VGNGMVRDSNPPEVFVTPLVLKSRATFIWLETGSKVAVFPRSWWDNRTLTEIETDFNRETT